MVKPKSIGGLFRRYGIVGGVEVRRGVKRGVLMLRGNLRKGKLALLSVKGKKTRGEKREHR